MAIEIGGTALTRIHKMTTLEAADFVRHRVPGMEGDLTQDMGRASVRLQIEGIFYGKNAQEDLESLRDMYKAREPVDFLAEIVGQAYFSLVILERFEVRQSADFHNQFSYVLSIAEYVEPPEPETSGFPGVDASILDEAQSFMDIATLPDLLAIGGIPEVSDPLQPLGNALDQVKQSTEGLAEITESLSSLFGISNETTE